MINTMSKIRGQEKGPGYPQAESVLGEAMLRFGRELGEESSFGKTSADSSSLDHQLSLPVSSLSHLSTTLIFFFPSSLRSRPRSGGCVRGDEGARRG